MQADFLRGVTHDLQTPLTSIAALATELRAGEDLSDGAQGDLDSIAHQAERLRRMVSQLLVASRLDAGVLTPQQEVFAVQPLVERTWAALRAERPFELRVAGTAAPRRGRSRPPGAGAVGAARQRREVQSRGLADRVAIDGSDGRLAITVAIAAPAWTRQTRERAFEQFYRAEQARKLAPDGSGVGLYAARGLMRAMDGSVEIESGWGRGPR